jgi:hypothetical protein
MANVDDPNGSGGVIEVYVTASDTRATLCRQMCFTADVK